MREVVSSGEVDVIGVGRPFCVAPDLVNRVLSGSLDELPAPEKALRLGPGIFGSSSSNRTLRTLNAQAEMSWFYRQIVALSEGREPEPTLGIWSALISHFVGEMSVARQRTFKRSARALPASAASLPRD
jgi:hypothetical protein